MVSIWPSVVFYVRISLLATAPVIQDLWAHQRLSALCAIFGQSNQTIWNKHANGIF
jgi:hypothetical protein